LNPETVAVSRPDTPRDREGIHLLSKPCSCHSLATSPRAQCQ